MSGHARSAVMARTPGLLASAKHARSPNDRPARRVADNIRPAINASSSSSATRTNGNGSGTSQMSVSGEPICEMTDHLGQIDRCHRAVGQDVLNLTGARLAENEGKQSGGVENPNGQSRSASRWRRAKKRVH